MRQLPDTLPPHLSLAELQKINEQCNRFEAAWRAGERPHLEPYVAAMPNDPAALLHLVLLDVDYRRELGENPQAEEYLARFPSLDPGGLRAALAEASSLEPAPTWSRPGAPAISAAEFVDRLEKRGLLASELAALRAGLEAEPRTTAEGLANRLVAEGKLPEYQARALTAPVPIPFVLGPYVLEGWIAAGGMGCVFRATHARMKRTVALKVVHGETATHPDLLQRFQQEVEVAGRLRHPNIVTAFDAGEQDGVAYLVTELVEGEDLRSLVRRGGPLPVERAVDYVRQAASGLAHAHAQGIVHRDVKPSNLMLGSDGIVRVLDVGLARPILPPGWQQLASAAHTGATALTESGAVMGTVDYMAPEQAEDPRRVDARADVYSLGCTLHFLLTARPPYEGATVMERLLAHCRKAVPSLRAARPDVPAELDRLFGQLLAKMPDDRPAGMAAVLEALDPVAGRPRRFGRRRLLAAGGITALALAAGYFALRPGDKQETLPPLARIPFDARAEQRRWAAALDLPISVENAAGMRMVFIPPGIFQMGSADAEIQQLLARAGGARDVALVQKEAAHEVVIPSPFYLSATEVTVGQFRRFVKAARHLTDAEQATRDADGGWGWHPKEGWRRKLGCSWQNADQLELHDDHPAGNLTFNDALEYCRWLTGQTGKVCRLPTEAEWEFACRAGHGGGWCFGDEQDQLPLHAWYASDSGGVYHRVATRQQSNAFGLFDMHGNLNEWCLPPAEPKERDRPPIAAAGPWIEEFRPARGGTFLDAPDRTRSAARAWDHQHHLGPGIRVLQVIALPQ